MRIRTLIALFLLAFCGSAAGTITQEIRYSCKGANEVFLVWGVSNWQLVPEEQIPAGSFIKDKLLYTPMQKSPDGFFSAELSVKEGTVIDYVFWITRGPLNKGTDLWDLNAPKKDYHTLAVPGATTLVESKLEIRPVEPLSILDFSYVILLFSILLFVLALVFRKGRESLRREASPYVMIMGSAIVLALFLFLIRPSVLGISWDIVRDPARHLPSMLWTAAYDVVYVLAAAFVFGAMALLLRRFPRAGVVVAFLFATLCLISLLLGVLNIRIVELLGKPFNYQWLYYSDFLKSPDAKAAMAANTSTEEILRIVSICFSALLMGWGLVAGLSQLQRRSTLSNLRLASIPLLATIYCFFAFAKIKESEYSHDRLANPVTAFLASVNPFGASPALFTMEVADSLQYSKPRAGSLASGPANRLKNVLLFVLESAPAEYIDTYGGKYNVTPNLSKYKSKSITFRNIYAHAPATNLSMVSMLNSIYPWLSYNSLTEEHPDLNVPSLSGELKTRGYRTAFFNSADNRYQKAGEFLRNRRFDHITDCNMHSCAERVFEVRNNDWEYMNGKDDGCTARELTDWIAADPQKPFFSMMWTYQTHYPYFFDSPQRMYEPTDTMLNRYLNALHYGDSILGSVIGMLEARQLLDSTLIVVVGDHGEAFGRHDQVSHGRKIYEENLHVPCLLINPAFEERELAGVGGLVDIAPTILEMLGYSQPAEWEGGSLFAKTEQSRAYFFAPWSDYLFGYRQGDFKYIYNATKNETEIYNLKADPFEAVNLVLEKQHEVPLHHQRMAAWSQYVNRITGDLLRRKGQENILAEKK